MVFEQRRRREGLLAVRAATYFGFVLERDVEPLPNPFPPELAAAARAALVEALLAGATPHPDQTRLRRALDRFDFYWRRSGGRLAAAAPERPAGLLAERIQQVRSWEDFLEARLSLDVEATLPAAARAELEALPASVHLLGDRIALEYEVGPGGGLFCGCAFRRCRHEINVRRVVGPAIHCDRCGEARPASRTPVNI